MKALYSKIISVCSVTKEQRQRMFSLLQQYYANVEWEYFLHDLDAKDDVIFLLEKKSDIIQGFSTLKNLKIQQNGKNVFGVFSGDTVIAQEFWGQRLLGKAFLQYLFIQKAKHPLSLFYWVLISKGYKTYLLMANNFRQHYPRYEQATPPKKQALMDGIAHQLFGACYDEKTGLIQFSKSRGQLRPGIADIPVMERENPRISFFEQRNPQWIDGTELMCMAQMTWSMPIYYQCKSWWKRISRTILVKESSLKKLPESNK